MNFDLTYTEKILREILAIDSPTGFTTRVSAYAKAQFEALGIRAALIGAGVYASHGYERSHMDGVQNTLKLLYAYLCD